MNPHESRGLELPKGCKDLIDALELARPEKPKSGIFHGGLADLQWHLAWLLLPPRAVRSLAVRWAGQSDLVYLVYDGSSLWALIWSACGQTAHEPAIRDIFQEAGIGAITENGPCGGSRYPLPPVPKQAAEIMIEVLLRGCVVPERPVLIFDLHGA